MRKLLLLVLWLPAAVPAQTPIPLQGRPPVIADPIDTALKIQQIRNLKLENDRLQREIEAAAAKTAGRGSHPAQESPNLPSPGAPPSKAAPPPSPLLTWGFLNGRGWQAIAPGAKFIYVFGVSEGLLAEARSSRANYLPDNLVLAEIQQGVDRFYIEPENILIPIIQALKIVTMKAAGASQSDIDAMLSLQRKYANNAPERSSGAK